MLTGRANYEQYSRARDINCVSVPSLLTAPSIAADAAGYFWSQIGGNELADAREDIALTRAINGGLTGYEDGDQVGLNDRVELLAQAREVFA